MSFTGTVVIVSFNSSECLTACVASVAAHAPAARVIVVDNASVDGSASIDETFPGRVEVLRNQSNSGFARAVNQALAMISGGLVLLLNPDAYLVPESIELLVAELARHPECSLVGPQILNKDGSVQGSARGDPTLLTGLFGRTTLLARIFPGSHLARQNVRTETRLEPGESFAVDWVSGACMLASHGALAAVGGFDERYFLYWEDADLCRRLRQHGQSVRYVPAAKVVHAGGRSSRRTQTLATRAFHRSAFTYYATHVATTGRGRALAWCLLTLRCRLKLLVSHFAGSS